MSVATAAAAAPAAAADKMRVGFIGLGLMGQGMARNILRAGYPLTVWNRTRGKEEPLAALGAQRAESPSAVAAVSDVVITIVSDTPDVQAVLLGEQGVAAGARPGLAVIDMSTISPAATRAMAAELAARGVDMLDAPVSGGTEGADQGTLTIMVGGAPAVFARMEPLLRTMGHRVTHMGDHGSGQSTKLVNQIVAILNTLALSEGLVFAAKADLDLKKVVAAIGAGAAGSWLWSHRGPQIVAGDFAPGFTIALQQKDLGIALDAARQMHLPLPGTALVHQLYSSLEAKGLSGEGNHALIKALEDLGGIEARQP